MNRLRLEARARIIRLLVEGNGIGAISRLMDVSKNTVSKLLSDIGRRSLDFQDEVFRDLPCKRLQCIEIWSFHPAGEPRVPDAKKGEFRSEDVWTWTALCADTNLVPCWHISSRTAADAKAFIEDLAPRLPGCVQLKTEGHKARLWIVAGAYGTDLDDAILEKLYGSTPESEGLYNQTECIGAEKQVVSKKPNRSNISPSYEERKNLNMRTNLRRFTRLSHTFSKKARNLLHSVSLHFMYYNFAQVQGGLLVTPAMKAGVSSHVWEVEEIVALDD